MKKSQLKRIARKKAYKKVHNIYRNNLGRIASGMAPVNWRKDSAQIERKLSDVRADNKTFS